ncbi:MAG: methyltransferase domain-containing protein, partial [Nitrosopumilaceae archaeon]
NCESILDLACGTGILTFQIAKKLPEAKILGVDITKSYLEIARKKLKPHHKISFLCEDAEKLALGQKFDCITSSYIPKYCKAEVLIKICLNHLNPGGKIILHDFTYPKNRIVRSLWNLYFVVLRLAGYLITNWRDVFVDLPKLIKETRWLEDYVDTMKKNGLEVNLQSLTVHTSCILTGIKKI